MRWAVPLVYVCQVINWLLIDAAVCGVLTWYLDAVLAKPFGMRRSPLFCITDLRHCCRRQVVRAAAGPCTGRTSAVVPDASGGVRGTAVCAAGEGEGNGARQRGGAGQ